MNKGSFAKWMITTALGVAIGSSGAFYEMSSSYKNMLDQVPRQKAIAQVLNSQNLETAIQENEEMADSILYQYLPDSLKTFLTVDSLTPEKIEELTKKDILPETPRPSRKFLDDAYLTDALFKAQDSNREINLGIIKFVKGLAEYLDNETDTVYTDRVSIHKAVKILESKDIDLGVDLTCVEGIEKYQGIIKIRLSQPMRQVIPKAFKSEIEILSNDFNVFYKPGSDRARIKILDRNSVKFNKSRVASFGGKIMGNEMSDCFVDLIEIYKNSKGQSILLVTGRKTDNNNPYQIEYNLTTTSAFDFKGRKLEADKYQAILRS